MPEKGSEHSNKTLCLTRLQWEHGKINISFQKSLILNLGCGTRTSSLPNVVNIDWSMMLRFRKNRVLNWFALHLLKGARLERFKSLPDNILVHNIAKDIPFENGSVDVVYHSHVLEHLDKDVAKRFLLECQRVLKPGGVIRIVVPDLERLCGQYLTHCRIMPNADIEAHEHLIAEIIEQCVRREAHGTSLQKPIRRKLENLLLGDARSRGETHQWMYDRFTLRKLLEDCGYISVQTFDHLNSNVDGWGCLQLDANEAGGMYIANSLFIEAFAP